jgi:hypothetical protein
MKIRLRVIEGSPKKKEAIQGRGIFLRATQVNLSFLSARKLLPQLSLIETDYGLQKLKKRRQKLMT